VNQIVIGIVFDVKKITKKKNININNSFSFRLNEKKNYFVSEKVRERETSSI